ncbi:cytochrome P450 [Micromonospora sp. NPDC003197]
MVTNSPDSRALAATPEELFDPLSPQFIEDPYPTYHRMRTDDPVHWHEQLTSWVVSRYGDCLRVIEDSASFAADYRRVGIPAEPQTITVQTLDPPDQLPVRRLLADAFRAQGIPALRGDLHQFADRAVKELLHHGRGDLVTDLAIPLTAYGIARILGGDLSQREDFQDASQAVVRSMMAGVAPETEQPGLTARARLSELIRQAYEHQPDSGILGYLRSRDATATVGTDLLMNSLRAVLLAGLNTGQRFVGNATYALLRTPEALATFGRLTERSQTTALHELLRFDTPFQAQERVATTDTRLGTRRIRRGDRVVALFGSAHRDPTVFPNPDELVLTRHPNPHFGFGRGSHACLGAALAFAEARAVFIALAAAGPTVRIAGNVVREPNPTLRGLASLPVELAVG